MPYLSEKITIAGTAYDRRRKLSEADKLEIRHLRTEGWQIRAIARLYPQISRRTIQFVLYPERLTASKVNRDWRKYYKKEANTTAIRQSRNYKQSLFLQHLI